MGRRDPSARCEAGIEPAKAPNAAVNMFVDRGLRPKRSFGQCFLADSNIGRIIAEEATKQAGGTVLEIGAGTGALTELLLKRGAKVIAIERDRDLVALLRESLAIPISEGQLRVVEADAVSADWMSLVASSPGPHVIAGNLPYQITGRLLQRAIECAHQCERAVFMVQKEVAQRVAADKGTKDYGALTVFVRSAFDVKLRLVVPASCFKPRPKIDSAVIVLDPIATNIWTRTVPFAELVRAAFAKRRKTLRNAWRGATGLTETALQELASSTGIDLDARGETLGVSDFVRAAERVCRMQGRTA